MDLRLGLDGLGGELVRGIGIANLELLCTDLLLGGSLGGESLGASLGGGSGERLLRGALFDLGKSLDLVLIRGVGLVGDRDGARRTELAQLTGCLVVLIENLALALLGEGLKLDGVAGVERHLSVGLSQSLGVLLLGGRELAGRLQVALSTDLLDLKRALRGDALQRLLGRGGLVTKRLGADESLLVAGGSLRGKTGFDDRGVYLRRLALNGTKLLNGVHTRRLDLLLGTAGVLRTAKLNLRLEGLLLAVNGSDTGYTLLFLKERLSLRKLVASGLLGNLVLAVGDDLMETGLRLSVLYGQTIGCLSIDRLNLLGAKLLTIRDVGSKSLGTSLGGRIGESLLRIALFGLTERLDLAGFDRILLCRSRLNVASASLEITQLTALNTIQKIGVGTLLDGLLLQLIVLMADDTGIGLGKLTIFLYQLLSGSLASIKLILNADELRTAVALGIDTYKALIKIAITASEKCLIIKSRAVAARGLHHIASLNGLKLVLCAIALDTAAALDGAQARGLLLRFGTAGILHTAALDTTVGRFGLGAGTDIRGLLLDLKDGIGFLHAIKGADGSGRNTLATEQDGVLVTGSTNHSRTDYRITDGRGAGDGSTDDRSNATGHGSADHVDTGSITGNNRGGTGSHRRDNGGAGGNTAIHRRSDNGNADKGGSHVRAIIIRGSNYRRAVGVGGHDGRADDGSIHNGRAGLGGSAETSRALDGRTAERLRMCIEIGRALGHRNSLRGGHRERLAGKAVRVRRPLDNVHLGGGAVRKAGGLAQHSAGLTTLLSVRLICNGNLAVAVNRMLTLLGTGIAARQLASGGGITLFKLLFPTLADHLGSGGVAQGTSRGRILREGLRGGTLFGAPQLIDLAAVVEGTLYGGRLNVTSASLQVLALFLFNFIKKAGVVLLLKRLLSQLIVLMEGDARFGLGEAAASPDLLSAGLLGSAKRAVETNELRAESGLFVNANEALIGRGLTQSEIGLGLLLRLVLLSNLNRKTGIDNLGSHHCRIELKIADLSGGTRANGGLLRGNAVLRNERTAMDVLVRLLLSGKGTVVGNRVANLLLQLVILAECILGLGLKENAILLLLLGGNALRRLGLAACTLRADLLIGTGSLAVEALSGGLLTSDQLLGTDTLLHCTLGGLSLATGLGRFGVHVGGGRLVFDLAELLGRILADRLLLSGNATDIRLAELTGLTIGSLLLRVQAILKLLFLYSLLKLKIFVASGLGLGTEHSTGLLQILGSRLLCVLKLAGKTGRLYLLVGGNTLLSLRTLKRNALIVQAVLGALFLGGNGGLGTALLRRLLFFFLQCFGKRTLTLYLLASGGFALGNLNALTAHGLFLALSGELELTVLAHRLNATVKGTLSDRLTLLNRRATGLATVDGYVGLKIALALKGGLLCGTLLLRLFSGLRFILVRRIFTGSLDGSVSAALLNLGSLNASDFLGTLLLKLSASGGTSLGSVCLGGTLGGLSGSGGFLGLSLRGLDTGKILSALTLCLRLLCITGLDRVGLGGTLGGGLLGGNTLAVHRILMRLRSLHLVGFRTLLESLLLERGLFLLCDLGLCRLFYRGSIFRGTQSRDLLLGQKVGSCLLSLGCRGACFRLVILQLIAALRAELDAGAHLRSALSARYCFLHGRSPI